MPNPSPTLRRRSLSVELLRLRKAKGLTAEEADIANGWTKGKTARMERNEWVRPDPRDIRDLLDLYEATDTHRREELLSWARQGREKGWWHPYRAMLSEELTTFIGLEYGASSLRVFELAVIPGILQTADYARAHMQRRPGELAIDEIDKRVDIRVARQQILTGPDPTRLRVVVDEAALRRAAGGPEIMRAQMHHLMEMAELPLVEIQIIPFSAGTHAGTQGPFTILEFDGEDRPAVYTENVAGELFIEDPEEITRFRLAFERLTATALDPDRTIRLVEEIAKTLA
jgi:hypothetical protein